MANPVNPEGMVSEGVEVLINTLCTVRGTVVCASKPEIKNRKSPAGKNHRGREETGEVIFVELPAFYCNQAFNR